MSLPKEEEVWVNEETAVVLTVAIAAILVLAFVAYAALKPPPAERFVVIATLGPNKMATDYPTPDNPVRAGEPVKLWVELDNYMGKAIWARVLVKLGQNEKVLPTTEKPADLPVIKEYQVFLANEESRLLEFNYVIDTPGENYDLIFELWLYDEQSHTFVFTGQWNRITFSVV